MATKVAEVPVESRVSQREYSRRAFYKTPIKKDNLRLEMDWDSSQEERRKFLLEHQKRCREQNFNAARGILSYLSELQCKDKIQEEWNCENGDYEDEDFDEEYYEIENYKDEESGYEQHYTEISHKYRKMMLSEWMVVVPEDLAENWIMVPCPVGNRTRLISGLGKTRAYSRHGELCAVFHSALPGGSLTRYPNCTRTLQYAVLDCIWVKTKKVYYVLDVLFWSSLPFTDCEVDCRQYWLKSKLAEIENLQDHNTDSNKYPILPLPTISCSSNLTVALENLDPELLPLDGLLFYHRAASYTFMKTPLVTWLKPYMLSEKLGVFVPPPLDERPSGYVNFEHFIEQLRAKRIQNMKMLFTVAIEEKYSKMEIEDREMETENEKQTEKTLKDGRIGIENKNEEKDKKMEVEDEGRKRRRKD